MTLKNIRLYQFVKDEDKLKRIKQIEQCRKYSNEFFDCTSKHIRSGISKKNCGPQYIILNKCLQDIL